MIPHKAGSSAQLLHAGGVGGAAMVLKDTGPSSLRPASSQALGGAAALPIDLQPGHR